MTIIKKSKYRLRTIGKYDNGEFRDMPVSYGLGIEKRCPDTEDSWYVILFIRYKDKETYIDCVGDRLIYIEADEWAVVKELIKCGHCAVSAANMEE